MSHDTIPTPTDTTTDPPVPSSAASADDSSPRPSGAVPWGFAGVAALFPAAVLLTGGLPAPAWRWAVVAVGVVGAIATRRRRLPIAFALVLLLAAVRLASSELLDAGPLTIGALDAALNLAVGVTLGLLVLVGFRYRNGRLGTRDVIDAVAVVIGTAVVAWLAVCHPLVHDRGMAPGIAVLVAAYLPMASLLVVFTLDVVFSGLPGNRTMWFATAAAVAHLAAAWVWSLAFVGTLPAVAADFAFAGYASGLCLLAAALTHRDARRSLTPVDPHRDRSDSVVRVTIVGVSVIVPVTLVATIRPTSADDVVVRAIGIGLLVVAVVVRLSIATHQHREAREALLQQVMRDDLTRLPTRSRFIEDVADILESTWHTPRRTTVIQLNLDRFKNINDTFGHYAANDVLVEVADRLRGLAESIGAIAARVGGDDFALVHGETTSSEEALGHAEAVREILATPVDLGDASVFVTASIGVALAPRNRTTAAEDLMRHADIAAHRAKQNGRNRIEVFDESMQEGLTRRMDVEHALHGAIGRQEMKLYHQPIVDTATGRLSGFEALMRWQRQDGTIVSPADFIPVAEETGIICELGAWALRDALRELRRWIDAGVVPPTTTMSVNVSPRQVADPAFPDIVRDAILDSGVPAHLLWVEITESMMLDEPEVAAGTMARICDLGVRIAMDDFGTGYSSLSLLQQFPIHRIKIDRAFVQVIDDQDDDRSLVRTIIAMARSMELDLVAEGVETVRQLEVLRDLGCDKVQGFLISRPVPADAMRSTMVALDEMASLSIFSPDVADTTAHQVVESSPARPGGTPPRFAVAGPLGPMSSRPLGGPML